MTVDISTISTFRIAREREDLVLAPGETFLAGGTWLMSEPQPEVTGFVDLTGMGWPDLEVTPHGLRISATCTVAELVAFARGRTPIIVPGAWLAVESFEQAADALLASFKIWNTATVGGNICRSFAAAAMVALTVALDGTAEVWAPGGGVRHVPVAEIVTGNGTNDLARGEVLRAIDLPARALESRLVLRKIALAEYGRSGAVVIGRTDADGTTVFGITAGTQTPVVLRFAKMPDALVLESAVGAAPGYYSDPLGAADWRRHVSIVLAERIRRELVSAA
jgi:CO/xanthine dehydrogenase FAD-binding subunit